MDAATHVNASAGESVACVYKLINLTKIAKKKKVNLAADKEKKSLEITLTERYLDFQCRAPVPSYLSGVAVFTLTSPFPAHGTRRVNSAWQ